MTELVVLPGLDATGTLHDEFLNLARTQFDAVRVMAYPRDQRLDYTGLEAWVRERLPTRASFVLLGESFSGPIALAIAASPPAMLRGLVLTTTFACFPVPVLSSLAPLIANAPLPKPPMRLLSPLLLGRWTTSELESRLGAALKMVPTSVLRFRAALALRADVSSLLSKISLPVLYIRATEDRLLSQACGDQILSMIPRSVGHAVPGPHLLLQAAPQECARAVGRFVEGL